MQEFLLQLYYSYCVLVTSCHNLTLCSWALRQKLIVAEAVKELTVVCGTWEVVHIHRSTPIGIMLRFLEPVYALESDLFIIHFNIIFLLTCSFFKFFTYSFICFPYPSTTAKYPVCLSFFISSLLYCRAIILSDKCRFEIFAVLGFYAV